MVRFDEAKKKAFVVVGGGRSVAEKMMVGFEHLNLQHDWSTSDICPATSSYLFFSNLKHVDGHQLFE